MSPIQRNLLGTFAVAFAMMIVGAPLAVADHNTHCGQVPNAYYVCTTMGPGQNDGVICWIQYPGTGDPGIDAAVVSILQTVFFYTGPPPDEQPPRDPGCYVFFQCLVLGGEAFSPGHQQVPYAGYDWDNCPAMK